MRRRTFFAASAAAGLSIYARGGDKGSLQPGDIPKRVFGKTGERLTIIGQAGGRFPMCSYEDAKAITLRAYELGINYFDSARIYWDGKSEEVYGDVLRAVPKAYLSHDEIPSAFSPGSRGGPRKIPAGFEDGLPGPVADSPGFHDGRGGANLRAGRSH